MEPKVERSGKPGPKPGGKRGGRTKGTPNKMTKELKEMILGALGDAGGQEYLVQQARDNPTAFMTLVGKVLPLTVAGDAANPLQAVHTIELVALAGSSSTTA